MLRSSEAPRTVCHFRSIFEETFAFSLNKRSSHIIRCNTGPTNNGFAPRKLSHYDDNAIKYHLCRFIKTFCKNNCVKNLVSPPVRPPQFVNWQKLGKCNKLIENQGSK